MLDVKKDGSQKDKIWGTRTHKWQKIACCPVSGVWLYISLKTVSDTQALCSLAVTFKSPDLTLRNLHFDHAFGVRIAYNFYKKFNYFSVLQSRIFLYIGIKLCSVWGMSWISEYVKCILISDLLLLLLRWR